MFAGDRHTPVLISGALLFLFPVFIFGSKASADMPLGFIDRQNLTYLPIQSKIVILQSLGQILVHRRFGNAEPLCGSPDRGAVFDDVHSQFSGSCFHVVCQSQHSLHIVVEQCMSDFAALFKTNRLSKKFVPPDTNFSHYFFLYRQLPMSMITAKTIR